MLWKANLESAEFFAGGAAAELGQRKSNGRFGLPQPIGAVRSHATSQQQKVLQGRFYTWGSHLWIWEDGRLQGKLVTPQGVPLAAAGCSMDFTEDGVPDLVVQQQASAKAPEPALLFYDGASRQFSVIDSPTFSSDCLAVRLFGRPGVLLLHRGMQLRFHYHAAGKWLMKELYSIYTPSWQGGLAIRDINRDGLPDIVCGNYWVRSPGQFDGSWRLFAINALHGDILHGEADAANVTLVAWPGRVMLAMRGRRNTPVRFFHQPPDPEQLWPEEQAASVGQAVVALKAGPWGAMVAQEGVSWFLTQQPAPSQSPARQTKSGMPEHFWPMAKPVVWAFMSPAGVGPTRLAAANTLVVLATDGLAVYDLPSPRK